MATHSVGLSTRLAWAFAVCAVLVQHGCMSMQPVVTTGSDVPLAVEVGDRLRILDKQGTTTELVVTTVGGDFFEGTAAEGRVVRVAAADVQQLHERRLAIGKTIALAAGIGALVIADDVTEDVLDFGP
jgi:hypothetical protein